MTKLEPLPSCAPQRRTAIAHSAGFTLLEVVLTVAIVGVLAAIALPAYDRYQDRVRSLQAVNDIASMATIITQYGVDNRALPDTLDDVGLGDRLDPWGRPYQYQELASVDGKGMARKDKKLNPLNSDFDLYSIGKDGETKLPLTPKVSHDDIIRALDGRFVGLAEDFDP